VNLRDLEVRLAELSPLLAPHFSLEFGDAVIAIEADKLKETALELREIGFDRLGMLTAVDYTDRFMLVYRLQSRSLSSALFIKTEISRQYPAVESLCEVWPAANWQEREVFDLFGIAFMGHPDLRRILLPEDFDGFPLRKDYDDRRLIRRPDHI
jgi:NADH-quinone oxidoreductase subunit C